MLVYHCVMDHIVRHTVGFTQALRHTLRLSSNTDISYNMVFLRILTLVTNWMVRQSLVRAGKKYIA